MRGVVRMRTIAQLQRGAGRTYSIAAVSSEFTASQFSTNINACVYAVFAYLAQLLKGSLTRVFITNAASDMQRAHNFKQIF